MSTRQITSAVLAAIALSCAGADEPRAFDCTGRIAFVCGGEPQRLIMLQDGEPQEVSLSRSFWLKDAGARQVKSGDVIHVTGVATEPAGLVREEKPYEPALMVTNLVHLGFSPFSGGRRVTARQINAGEYRGELVRLAGVVSAVMRDEMNPLWNWLVLRTRPGDVYVATPDHEHPYGELLALTDAEVEATGFVIEQSRWRRFRGQYIIPVGENGMKATKGPPPLEAVAPLPAGCLDVETLDRLLKNGGLVHRVKIDGRIIAASRRFCFLHSAEGHILKVAPLSGACTPACGSRVAAIGFVSLDSCGINLGDAVFAEGCRDLLEQPLPCADAVDIEQLFAETKNPSGSSPFRLRRLVSVAGTVVNPSLDMSGGSSIRIEQNGCGINVDVSALTGRGPVGIPSGCEIRVTGVCDAEFSTESAIASFPRFAGLSIFPMSARDIVVVKRPPWWTPGKMYAAILSLLGALAVISVLCVALKVMSDKRGRQLYDERVAHIRTEAKVEERTRLAVELHDAISQTLTGVALQVDSAARANGDDANTVGSFLKTARNMLASCRRELKDCLWDLRSRTFEEKDMTEAIIRTIGPHKGDAAASVRFNIPRERLSESTTHAILSIVRELTVNAIRHGKATHIWIAGEHHDGTITFSVRDNGSGFELASAPGPQDGHFGLQGIRERVNDSGGSVDVASVPGAGAKVTVSIKMEASACSGSPERSRKHTP